MIKGRYDEFKRTDKILPDNPDNIERWTTHFSNIKGINESYSWKDAVVKRVVNRVDFSTGKARDYFEIHEIDNTVCSIFIGKISINIKDNDTVCKIKQLIAAGLAGVNVIAGSFVILYMA